MFHWYYMITSKGKKTHVTCESQISNYIVNQLIFRLALWHNGNILNFPWIEGSEAAKESQPLNLTMGGSEATEETPATVAVATKRGATHISSKNRISVLDDQRIQDLENRHKRYVILSTHTLKRSPNHLLIVILNHDFLMTWTGLFLRPPRWSWAMAMPWPLPWCTTSTSPCTSTGKSIILFSNQGCLCLDFNEEAQQTFVPLLLISLNTTEMHYVVQTCKKRWRRGCVNSSLPSGGIHATLASPFLAI